MTDDQILDLINEFKDRKEVNNQMWKFVYRKLTQYSDIHIRNDLRDHLTGMLVHDCSDSVYLWERLGSQLGRNLSEGLKND